MLWDLKLEFEINREMKEWSRWGRLARVDVVKARQCDLPGLQPSVIVAWPIDFKMNFEQKTWNGGTKMKTSKDEAGNKWEKMQCNSLPSDRFFPMEEN